MLNLKQRWQKQRQLRDLRELRRDPHLAKDIGLLPIERGPKIDQILW